MVGSVFVGIGAIIANAENICNLIIKFDSKILAVCTVDLNIALLEFLSVFLLYMMN